jgi:hypothetical protein
MASGTWPEHLAELPKRVRRLAVLILTHGEAAAPLTTAGTIATVARLRQIALTLVDVA